MAARLLLPAPSRPDSSGIWRLLAPLLAMLLFATACGSSSSVVLGQAEDTTSTAGDDIDLLADTTPPPTSDSTAAPTTSATDEVTSTTDGEPGDTLITNTSAPTADLESTTTTIAEPTSTAPSTDASVATTTSAAAPSSTAPPGTAKATTTSGLTSTTPPTTTSAPPEPSTTAAPTSTTGVQTTAAPTTALPTTTAAPVPTTPPTTVPPTTSTTTAATTTTSAATPNGPLECSATLADHVGQLLLPIVPASQLVGLSDAVAAGRVGGIAILGPVDQQLDDRLAALQELAGDRPLLIMVDEEGGRVRRMTSLGPPQAIPAAATQAELSSSDLTDMFEDHGNWMREWGINVDLAPVVDVGGGPAIGTRSFSPSGDPDVVVAGAGSVIDGLTSAGTLAVLKHFPGHGAASADSHKALPTTPAWDPTGVHVQPFTDLIRRAEERRQPLSVMVGHLNVPGLTDGLPATLSANAYRVLRGELGFDGLVMTDSLDMGAIGISQPDAALRAVTAGTDMAMIEGRFVDQAFESLNAAASESSVLEERVRNASARVQATKIQVANAPQCP